MNENLDSFFIMGEKPDTIEAWCSECRNKEKSKQGWFWSGKKGYGPWDVRCHFCNKYIHHFKEDEKNV